MIRFKNKGDAPADAKPAKTREPGEAPAPDTAESAAPAAKANVARKKPAKGKAEDTDTLL